VQDDVVFTIREPLGVILCIVPFNYPANLCANKVIPALLMGNSVIIKPSTHAPLDILFLARLLIDAGVHPKAVQCVTGSGKTVGLQLAGSPFVDAISLTGSKETGIAVAKAAAVNMTRCFFELGGNDAMIVCADADLANAVSETVFGRLHNGGQSCCAPKRFFVDNSVRDKFTDLLREALATIKVGDPHDSSVFFGPLISESAAVEVERQVQATINQGAHLVCGGKRRGAFFEPTIIDNVSSNMDIAHSIEVFGPVIPIIGFNSIDEAIKLANATEYGLSGGVVTNDLKVALKVAVSLDTGAVVIGGSGFYRFDHQPFGGHKNSGNSNEGVSTTLEEMSQLKTIVFTKQLAR
jgi:succinate-semialdehyde dehydrogenase/glutarate-semialdehyde dehydrogenase